MRRSAQLLYKLREYRGWPELIASRMGEQEVGADLLVGDAGPKWLHVTDIGLCLVWVAALLTMITGYDYLRAGLAHMDETVVADPGQRQDVEERERA